MKDTSTSYVQGIVLSVFNVLASITIRTAPWNKCNYDEHHYVCEVTGLHFGKNQITVIRARICKKILKSVMVTFLLVCFPALRKNKSLQANS